MAATALLRRPPRSTTQHRATDRSADSQRSRTFLTQATFVPAPADIDRVVALGYAAWLDEQFNSQASLHLPAVPVFGDTITPHSSASFHCCLRSGPRRRSRPIRCGSADVFVVAAVRHLDERQQRDDYPQGIATYMDLLAAMDSATSASCWKDVTLSPMMGLYPVALGNQKEDPASGRVPDENYAAR